MFLLDDKLDSLVIYADWLEDNEQLALATEIRLGEVTINIWHAAEDYFYKNYGVGVYYADSVGSYFSESKPNGINVNVCYFSESKPNGINVSVYYSGVGGIVHG